MEFQQGVHMSAVASRLAEGVDGLSPQGQLEALVRALRRCCEVLGDEAERLDEALGAAGPDIAARRSEVRRFRICLANARRVLQLGCQARSSSPADRRRLLVANHELERAIRAGVERLTIERQHVDRVLPLLAEAI